VAILSVDAASNTALGLTRRETQVQIDLSYHVGSVQVTPSVGEQWYITKQTPPTPRMGITWVLDAKIPFNTPEITLPATEGQQQIGTGKGPIQLHGTQVNANGPLRLANANSSLADSIARARDGHKRAASLPGASTVDAGSLVYNGAAPAYSNGSNWIQLGTYDLPSGGIPNSQLAADVQALLALAGSAFQLPSGGISATDLTTEVQNFLSLAGTALQDVVGSVGLGNLHTSGTPSAGQSLLVDSSGTGLTFGTPSTSGTSSGLLSLLEGMTGISGALPADLIGLWTSVLGDITGLATGTLTIPELVAGIVPRLQNLSPNGLINSQALDNIAGSILRNLDGTGKFDAAQLFNINNIPSIPQEAISGLTYTISQLLQVVDFQNLLQGLFGTTSIGSFLGVPGLLSGFGTSTSILTQLLGLFPGLAGGLSGLPGLGAVFTDLTGLLGTPTGLGSGSPTLPGVGSIPVLGGLLGSGNLLGGGLSTASPITTQLLGLFPGLATGLSGLTGLGSVFTDLTGLLGTPTHLGSGSPSLPGIGSIPLLGGLLSGGTTLLTSLIPGLDASKIVSGIFGTGLIPGLDASKIVSGIFGSGFIPGLDASKIISGAFPLSMTPLALATSLWKTGKQGNTNLVIDPQFEDSTITHGSALGTGASLAYSTVTARSGTQCLALTTQTSTTGQNDFFMLAPVPTTGIWEAASGLKTQPGQTFYCEFYVKAKATNTATVGTVAFGISFVDSTGVTAQTYVGLGTVNMSGLSSSAWTKVSGWYTVPAGYDTAFPFAWTNACNAANQVFYFDDALVREETRSQSIISNLWGSVGSPLTNILAAVVPGLDASKIISGIVGVAQIPLLDAAKIVSGVFGQSLIPSLTSGWGGSILSSFLSGTLGTGLIPGLDASKIISGVLGGTLIPLLPASQITSGTFLTSLIPGLDASKIISGAFPQSMITSLTSDLGALLPINIFNQRTNAGSNLVISPNFDDSTIYRSWGSFPGTDRAGIAAGGAADQSYSTDVAHSGTQSWKMHIHGVTGGGFTGTNSEGWLWLLPNVNDIENEPNPPTSAIKVQPGQKFYLEVWVYGAATNTQPNHMALTAQIWDSKGVNPPSSIDAQIIAGYATTGAWTQLSGYVTIPTGYDLFAPYADANNYNGSAGDSTFYWDDATIREETAAQNIINSLFGGSSILGSVLSSVIPGLDVSKIISGVFGSGFIPGLDASKIISGIFGTGLIPGLDVSKIISGVFGSGFIPGLDASKIISGAFPLSMTPLALAQSLWQTARIGQSSLVINGDFSDSTINRGPLTGAGGSFAYTTTTAHSGTQCIQFTGGTASGASETFDLGPYPSTGPFTAVIKAQPGQSFYAEAYIKAGATNTTTAGSVGIAAFLTDSTGVNANTIIWFGSAVGMNVIPNSSWTKLGGVYTIPAGYDTLQPFAWMVSANVGSQVWYWDDALIREESRVQQVISNLWGGVGNPLTNILSSVVPGLDASKIISGLFSQVQIPSLTSGWAGTVDVSRILGQLAQTAVSGVLGGATTLADDLTGLVTNAVGLSGGSGFPWAFPISFGGGNNNLASVGTAIAGSTQLAQQVLDTIVKINTGSTATNNSLSQLEAALRQQPGSTIVSQLPPAVLPDITLPMSTALQAVHASTGLNTSDINDIVSYAEQESAAALGTFIGNTGGIAQAAQGFAGGAVDTINSVLSGIPVVGSELSDLFKQFTGFLTPLHNNWTGSTLPAATSTDVAAAALNSATQANQQSQLISSIQTQLPKFYGGGNSGISYQTGFVGGLPAGFVAFTPGSGPAYNCAINTAQKAQTDTQAVSGIWSTADGWAKALILRSNAAATSFHYAEWWPGGGVIGVCVAGVYHTLLSFAAPAFVANYAYTFEAVGRQLTLTGPGGLDATVTDSGNVGTINSNCRYGGFGTDGSIIQTQGWGAAGGYTFTPPGGLVNGDLYDIYGYGAGGGGGGGVDAWGNGGGGGGYSENYGIGGSGSISGSTIIGAANGLSVGQQIAITIGGGGPPGSSEYYATGEITYYYYGGNSGLSKPVYANYGSSGAAGGATGASWSGALGSGSVYCPGGAGGAAYGGAPTGGGSYGAAQGGEALVNGSAPAYNGYNGNQWGGGGSGCYSGSGQTYEHDYYGTLGSHTYDYIYGVNGAQSAGAGYDGVMWIDSVSRQLPGSIASFAFWDAAISGPQYVAVQPGTYTETTTSTTWADLATTSDQLTVNVGPSGMVAIFISCEFAYNTAVNGQCFISIGITGANNIGTGFASSGMQTSTGAGGLTADSLFGFYLMTGGAQGATVFKMKYLVNTGTGNFGPRYMLAIPF
jgi:hypothetical protein